MSIQKKVLIFAATFNEKDNIELLIQSILNNYSNADILIIDDNSPDKTSEKIKELQRKFKNILLAHVSVSDIIKAYISLCIST